nr:glycosyltransferase [Variibacter gotjawalensis]
MDIFADQTLKPMRTIVCAPSLADVGDATRHEGVEVVISERGLTRQRNAIIAALDPSDIVVFLDDDFIPCPNYLREIADTFEKSPTIVMATGRVIADGINGPGLSFADAMSVLADAPVEIEVPPLVPVYNGYGCNMAVRLGPVFAHSLKFDDSLPLYGWLEDVDFSRQIARFGSIIKVSTARGVHLGVKSGRQSGRRLGYSQIANPLYLVRKGTCSWQKALYLLSRNVLANAGKLVRPEPYVDRQGRFVGNLRALADLVTGRLEPMRAAAL